MATYHRFLSPIRAHLASISIRTTLSETGRATTHNLALADQFGVELGAIKREKDIKIDTCIPNISNDSDE